ncbi:MAG: diaminopimelate epimerase, partial [Anaerolineae bacterium]|nr:diaminopimelate epimerase [Anaerolineae bacterium]
MPAHFYKYQALGNDMVVLDPASFTLPLPPPAIRLICDRHLGLGADGICYGPLPEHDWPTMRFFNPDGSESGKSGNGLRVFARYVWEQGLVGGGSVFEIGIQQEVIRVRLVDAAARLISTTMGRLSFNSDLIPMTGPVRQVVEEMVQINGDPYRLTAASIGNPHAVLFVEEVSPEVVREIGPRLETAPLFPQRTNVQLVQVLDRHTIKIEIWERGAGYTLASGSSACATAGAAIKTGRCRSPVEVRMAGGAATVEVDPAWHVTLTGPVEAVCRGEFAPELV